MVAKIQKPIASNGIKVPIPLEDPALGDGHASFDRGFPALNFTAKTAGGIPPWGEDMNGFLFLLSDLLKHYSSGGFFERDATHQTAVGGYPKGSLIRKLDGMGFWLSTVEGNVTDADSGGVGWANLSPERHTAASGSTVAYLADYNPNITTLYDGLTVTLDVTVVGTNTVIAPTFSPNGLAARTIVTGYGSLDIGSLPVKALLQYNANTLQWILLNPNFEVGLGQVLESLDYPTVATADNRTAVTPASGALGGTVSIPANVMMSLGRELVAGETGVMQVVKTSAFTSADLQTNDVYYLRAKFVDEQFTVYVQRGADSDPIPAGLVGIVDGASGGGFHSTKLDVLLAKITTTAAASIPTVIELANHKYLDVDFSGQSGISQSLAWATLQTLTINFARLPNVKISLQGFKDNNSVIGSGALTEGAKVELAAVDIESTSRYEIVTKYCYVDSLANSGSLIYNIKGSA